MFRIYKPLRERGKHDSRAAAVNYTLRDSETGELHQLRYVPTLGDARAWKKTAEQHTFILDRLHADCFRFSARHAKVVEKVAEIYEKLLTYVTSGADPDDEPVMCYHIRESDPEYHTEGPGWLVVERGERA